MVGDPLKQVPVMGDHHEGPRPAVEEILQRRQGVNIEVVRWLIEKQHVGLVEQDSHQLEPPTLATGEVGHPGLLAWPGEAEPLGQLARADRFAADDRARAD